VVLIDEPEAFLHPSLAFQLGKEISGIASTAHKSVFVSTHSSQFVMGCIQSGAPVNIVRLTYRSSVATTRVLKSAEVLKLMRNPLLRSTGVVNGLSYEFVVVTESDTDRAFYQEVNERLLRSGSDAENALRELRGCRLLGVTAFSSSGSLPSLVGCDSITGRSRCASRDWSSGLLGRRRSRSRVRN
jgi:hypothetical protein